jgi:bifunctional N-acetylglucosamine-1-phosphate-uridyltransferase/glucosamine-1-phosphate-acetyltransferase GlmU-like protein
MFENVAVIILAAGLGTRMKSSKAKVLHKLLNQPMVIYVVETAMQVAGQNVILVVGNQAEKVQAVVTKEADLMFATARSISY